MLKNWLTYSLNWGVACLYTNKKRLIIVRTATVRHSTTISLFYCYCVIVTNTFSFKFDTNNIRLFSHLSTVYQTFPTHLQLVQFIQWVQKVPSKEFEMRSCEFIKETFVDYNSNIPYIRHIERNSIESYVALLYS